MGVKCEEFFQSLLSKRADERSQVHKHMAKLEEVLMTANRVKGISASIDPKRLPKYFKDALSREDHQECRQ